MSAPGDLGAALHRALNLSVDSALAADDALNRGDHEAIATAVKALVSNSAAAQSLIQELQVPHA